MTQQLEAAKPGIGSRLDTESLEDRGQRVAQGRKNRQWDRCHGLCLSDLEREFSNLRAGTAVFRFDRDHWVTDGRAILV